MNKDIKQRTKQIIKDLENPYIEFVHPSEIITLIKELAEQNEALHACNLILVKANVEISSNYMKRIEREASLVKSLEKTRKLRH